MNEDKFQQDAIQILDRLTLMPFEERFTLDKTLCELPKCAGTYAVRHGREGILYIGKSLHIRNRFMGSHKANMRETGDPIEAVLEMAIISFLDLDAISFEDCRTDAPGRLRERVAILETVIERQGIDLPGVLS